ncbi:MAG: HD domain-containing protein [Desulfurococcales archaeon]|nr:HD domain-containing protein [Desulfurococcales archaeon]
MPSGLSVSSILGLSPGPLARIEWEARKLLGGDPAHGWPHVLRVAGWARRIVEGEGLRPRWLVLYAAIVLHDAGRMLAGQGEHHAVASARLARKLLAPYSTPRFIEEVEHAILAHSYSLGVRAETVEARVLSDADKLDALGAVGIARVFHTGCRMGRGFEDSLRHFHEKILRLPDHLYYTWSRLQAERLVRRVEWFLKWWSDEQPGAAREP